jgi:ABC-2 type transport system permease protein
VTALPLTYGQRLAGYVSVARVQVRIQLVYRGDFLFRLLGLLVNIYLLRLVWQAVYPASGTAAANGGHRITLATQIAYATLASVQNWLLSSGGMGFIPQRVRDGTVAVDLVRPVRFPTQMVWAQSGTIAAQLPFALAALPFALLVGGARPPASAGAALGYLLSLLPAALIALLMATLVQMVSFWTLETSGIFVIYAFVQQFLAGSLVPLWFMPEWLRLLAQWLPFQATTYAPVAVYLGQAGVWATLGTQLAWCAVLLMLLALMWRRALHRVVVQGG